MAEEAQGDDYDDIFVYMGGDQQVPRHIRRARIHKSVKIVRARAFQYRSSLIYVEFHDGVEIIEEYAFSNCTSFKGPIKFLGFKIIKGWAFESCRGLTAVEFGDKLETIERYAFHGCIGLKKIKMPSVRTIGVAAFANCIELSDVECGEALQTLEFRAYYNCCKLKRIALPTKDGMIGDDIFDYCAKLTKTDLVGGIHNTVAALNMESWRSEMNTEISRINQTLPTVVVKTTVIQQWMRTVISQLDHYKGEHQQLLKEATTLLELALWKANLDNNNGGEVEREGVRTRGNRKRARKEICVTSGADVVIKNVLPFLKLE